MDSEEDERQYDDRELVQAIAQGDDKAVRALVARYGSRVMQFIYRRLDGRREDAEELTQDTFLTAMRLAKGYRGDASVSTWLLGIAHVRVCDFYRRETREKRIPPKRLLPLDAVAEHGHDALLMSSGQELIESLLAGLSTDEKSVLIMRYVEELPVKTIASIMGRSEKSIEALLVRAKQKPRDRGRSWMIELLGGRQ